MRGTIAQLGALQQIQRRNPSRARTVDGMTPAASPSFHLVEGLCPHLEAKVNPDLLLVIYLKSTVMKTVINVVSEVSGVWLWVLGNQ